MNVTKDVLVEALIAIGRLERENEALGRDNLELSVACYQYRLVLEHYMGLCASIGAETKPAEEVLTRWQKTPVRTHLWRVK